MDAVEKRLADLLARVDAAPFGVAGRALLDECVALADQHDLPEWGYAARLRLLASAARIGDTDAQLSAFAWCVGRNAADPERFPLQVGDHDLLWYHKHVVAALTASPLFTLDDVESALEAMQEQYLRAGAGMSAVWQARFQATLGLGRPERAAGMLAALKRTPRDEYSHCFTCSRAEEAEFHYLAGHDQAGLALTAEILANDLSCGDEPANAMAHALLPLLRAGRPGEARRLHLRGYRLIRSSPDRLRAIAQHLRFCAVTGNEARGLEILVQHLRLLEHDRLNQLAHLDLLSAAVVLLTAVEQAGAGDQPVIASAPWTIRELLVALRARAAALAERFDQRNGNDFESRRLAQDEELLNTRYDVPLDTRPSPPPVLPVPAEQLHAEARRLRAEAENLADKEPARALSAAREGLRLALGLGNRELTISIARFGALAAMTMGEDEAAIEFCRVAVDEAATAELAAEPSFRLELGAALFRGGRAEEAGLEIEEALRQLRVAGAPPSELAVGHHQLGQAEAAQGRFTAARANYRDAIALASRSGDHAASTRYGLALGELLLSRDDPQGLTVLAGTVVSARNLTSNPQVQIGALHLLGRSLGAMHQDELAERVLREALHLADDAQEIPAIRYEHADVLDSISRAVSADPTRRDEAVELARRAADGFAAASARSEAGRALLRAASMLEHDQPGQALTLMERAAQLAAERPEVLVKCLDSLAELQERLGRTGEAHLSRTRADRLRTTAGLLG
ncbi:hypothetical protein Kisp01_55200 [Kineosporia sp. NBRC 101677]|uniref:hypothetical protein n=1 Tax=Kineosporia sp. NBRC 101677 TaxID=3032197 RepID=UPI0024A4EADF|nr:hypothetical protein [Kineosporia sp. NBRC 101677]GLY18506.1 hypothetical protein Kisp01_55200 [Kineosporia sp. NBRC 101677]